MARARITVDIKAPGIVALRTAIRALSAITEADPDEARLIAFDALHRIEEILDSVHEG